jgi:DNA-binding transcriptional regulator YhcF (GntR family)
MQRAYSQLQQEELIALRDLLRNVGEVIHRQEAVNRELTSGLRAEKAHVAQIKRQYELGGPR